MDLKKRVQPIRLIPVVRNAICIEPSSSSRVNLSLSCARASSVKSLDSPSSMSLRRKQVFLVFGVCNHVGSCHKACWFVDRYSVAFGVHDAGAERRWKICVLHPSLEDLVQIVANHPEGQIDPDATRLTG